MFGRGFVTHAPACSGCGWRIRIQRTGGFFLTLAIGTAVMFLVWPYLDDFVARSLRKWVAMGLALASISPYIFWETFFPPSIDITAFSDSVEYEFRDSDYAHEFAALNRDAAWVKID